MQPWVIEWGIVAASLAAFAGLYGLLLLASRPAGVTAGPASQDLGTETPALASILGNGWDLTEDAVEATLVDLGARRVIEFRQPANDPFHTTIHIVQSQPSGLNRYEQRVFDRVAGLAVDGVVPLTALAFRDKRKAKSWWKRLRAEIVAEARASGLSRRRFSPGQLFTLGVAAVIATAGLDTAVVHWALRQPETSNDDNPLGFIVPTSIFGFALLIGFATRDIGERDTPAGREAAARWLGVKAWLRAHESFADLPPSAVATWDRYISYGVALGASRVASTVIDMGMGNRRRVWSSFGGTWHRVRVSYPRLWWRYGQQAPTLLMRGLLSLGLGFVLVRWWRIAVDWVSAHDIPVPRAELVIRVGFGLGVALLVYGGYVFLRAFVDAVSRRTITGQVLWKQVWRTSSGGEDSPRVPWLYYLAVDDGRTDRTRAWGLPSAQSGSCDAGDTVTITVRRWSRRVLSVRVDERGTTAHVTDVDGADSPHETLVASIRGMSTRGLLSRPDTDSDDLLTADEVAGALGLVVVSESHTAGPMASTVFRTQDRKRAVLMVQVSEGPLADMAWRSNSRGRQVAGIGDGAWLNGNRAVTRKGDTIVVMTLVGKGKGLGDRLEALLRQAAERISVRAPS